MKKILGLILAVGLMLGALPARAEYPDKAITCIVPFAPGGAADITVRMVADYLSKEIGQPLVIVNKGGGSGIPGDAARQNFPGECVITSGTSDCTRCKKIAKAGHVPAFFTV